MRRWRAGTVYLVVIGLALVTTTVAVAQGTLSAVCTSGGQSGPCSSSGWYWNPVTVVWQAKHATVQHQRLPSRHRDHVQHRPDHRPVVRRRSGLTTHPGHQRSHSTSRPPPPLSPPPHPALPTPTAGTTTRWQFSSTAARSRASRPAPRRRTPGRPRRAPQSPAAASTTPVRPRRHPSPSPTTPPGRISASMPNRVPRT